MVGNYLTFCDGERGGNTFSIARTKQQARIVHSHATSIVEQSPLLFSESKINRTNGLITHTGSQNEYGICPGDNRDALEGANGNFLIDEGHVMDSLTYAIIQYAGASRMEPVELMVSTAGKNLHGWGKKEWDYGEDVNAGKVDDLELLHQAYSAPQDATDEELTDEKLWFTANPSMGTVIDPQVFRRELSAARRSPATWATFKMYRFNMWGQSSTRWIEPRVWKRSTHERKLSEFKGHESYLGLDMSLTRDMTGAVLIIPIIRDGFEDEAEGEDSKKYFLFPLFWITKAAVDRWADKVPFHEWELKGDLRIINGPKIEFPRVRADIIDIFGQTDVQSLTYDPTYATETAERLCESLDCDQIEFRQTLMEYAEPTQSFERLLDMGLLMHPNNAVLNWHSENVEITIPDRSGNYRPVKPQSSDKTNSRDVHRTIDGIQAGIMALREARKFESYSSWYDENELESI